MPAKSELRARNKKLKKKIKRLERVVAIGLRTIAERDEKLAQLTSVLQHEHDFQSRKNKAEKPLEYRLM